MFAVGITGFFLVGGIEGLQAIVATSKAGGPLISMAPPADFDLNSKILYPLPTIPTYCAIAGLSWIICNFGMAQRLLASKDESHAQKALIVAGVFNVFTLFFAYLAGVTMRKLMPEIEPDASFITMLTTFFPVGIRGLLVVGLMAALLSTIDGLLSSSSTLINQDIYSRFIRRNATANHLKWVARGIQVVIIGVVLLTIPVFLSEGAISTEKSAYEILLEFLGSIMGVLIAIFILGVFFKRTTAKASLTGMIVGIALGFILPRVTELNFAHVGTLQFIVVIALGVLLSLFEKKKSDEELKNLTIWTVEGIKGPFVGLSSWPALRWWAIGLPLFWLGFSILWEVFMVL
jgi:solute:Na+ symporter, SSS family